MDTTLTPRQTFRETVAAVAATAKAKLPQAVNGRVESAVKLVLGLDVEPQADGSILVGSSSDPLKQYMLIGQACTCQDFERGQAPEGWCQHRIAAAIAKRVQALLPDQHSYANVETRPPAASAPALPGPAALPEAAFSLTLKGTLDGVEALLTARGQTAAEFRANLEAIRGLLDAPTPPAPQGPPSQGQRSPQQHHAAAQHQRVSGFCKVHNVQMPWNEGKEGRKGWYSHRTDDGWCKGR